MEVKRPTSEDASISNHPGFRLRRSFLFIGSAKSIHTSSSDSKPNFVGFLPKVAGKFSLRVSAPVIAAYQRIYSALISEAVAPLQASLDRGPHVLSIYMYRLSRQFIPVFKRVLNHVFCIRSQLLRRWHYTQNFILKDRRK